MGESLMKLDLAMMFWIFTPKAQTTKASPAFLPLGPSCVVQVMGKLIFCPSAYTLWLPVAAFPTVTHSIRSSLLADRMGCGLRGMDRLGEHLETSA